MKVLLGFVLGSLLTGAVTAQTPWKDEEHRRIYIEIQHATEEAVNATLAAKAAQLECAFGGLR